ncbi:C1GALT1 [Lepeophtheirus salmonis]|uniref:C1GALT1 n=1 Tax=Lepeophtheirus salmonis TaxID=72036 RepID=A0A7R8CW44_LEPSM|nr:C1GALT1 [Lepeophtheirus salmonis]CAF2917369.1 C1GALT1 [Lepeophtheirus salmonis]
MLILYPLWPMRPKVMVSLDYVYNNYIDKIDWVLKTSDEVFTIPENLHYFINSKKLKSSDPLWFGSEYLSPSKSVFMSREGYVMSKAAVVKLMTEGKKLPKDKCKTQEHQLNEEDELAKCLKALDVKTVDTRDQLGRHRFISYDLGEMIIPVSDPNKREKRLRFPYQNGPNCCAQDPILLKGGTLAKATDLLEKVVYGKKYAVTVSLDCSGVFDNISFASTLTGLHYTTRCWTSNKQGEWCSIPKKEKNERKTRNKGSLLKFLSPAPADEPAEVRVNDIVEVHGDDHNYIGEVQLEKKIQRSCMSRTNIKTERGN